VRGGLWKEIIDSIYGGWREVKSYYINTRESLWWKDLKRIWTIEEWGNNFEDKVTWELGDGKLMNFWDDKWIDEDALKTRFPRLFSLSTTKIVNLSQVGLCNNNQWVWNIEW